MKHFTNIKYLVISIFMFLSGVSYCQDEMDFEEFMGMMSGSFSDYQLDELSFQLPWDIMVTAYAHGDFSGDKIEDFVIAIKEKGVTPSNTIDVYFLTGNKNDSYDLIQKKNYKWFELNIEVAFLVKDGLCFVTNRDNNNWYFTSYKVNKEKLILINKESFPIEFEKAGE